MALFQTVAHGKLSERFLEQSYAYLCGTGRLNCGFCGSRPTGAGSQADAAAPIWLATLPPCVFRRSAVPLQQKLLYRHGYTARGRTGGMAIAAKVGNLSGLLAACGCFRSDQGKSPFLLPSRRWMNPARSWFTFSPLGVNSLVPLRLVAGSRKNRFCCCWRSLDRWAAGHGP